jgi:hypothetical protein
LSSTAHTEAAARAAAKLEGLRAQLAQIDLAAARQQHEEALANAGRLAAAMETAYPSGAPGYAPDVARALRDRDEAARLAKSQRSRVTALEAEEAALRREIADLERLLSAEGRVRDGAGAVEACAGAKAAAQAQADAAQETLARVEGMIAEEESRAEREQSEAGARILAALKSGAKAPASPAPSNAAAALSVAKAGAEAELVAARASLKAAEMRHVQAQRDLDAARADVAELAYRFFALDLYVSAATDYLVACARARREAGIFDARALAIEAARPLVERASA